MYKTSCYMYFIVHVYCHYKKMITFRRKYCSEYPKTMNVLIMVLVFFVVGFLFYFIFNVSVLSYYLYINMFSQKGAKSSVCLFLKNETRMEHFVKIHNIHSVHLKTHTYYVEYNFLYKLFI